MWVRILIVVFLSLTAVGCRGLLRPFAAAGRAAPAAGLPTTHTLSAGQLVFSSNFEVPDGHRLVRELTAERDDVCRTLGLPCSNEPIMVYLFRDAKSYSECLSQDFPSVPTRRAFFLETDTQLAVYAHWSDRVAEDLRHEVAHGYLHAVAPGLPLWLDEGLAEYFEVPRNQAGFNRPHLELLADLTKHNGWQPDLERLERLSDITQMDQQSYAEAWAWVYFLLESEPQGRELLTRYLLDLRSSRGAVEPISARLKNEDAEPKQSLMAFLDDLNRRRAPQVAKEDKSPRAF
jgi:hypothetical protein